MKNTWLNNARKLLVKSEKQKIRYSQVIKKIEMFFGIKMRVRFKEGSSMWGEIDKKGVIHVGTKLNDRETILVLVHEGLHKKWDLKHDDLARKVNFRSYGEKDYFSELFARLIFTGDKNGR